MWTARSEPLGSDRGMRFLFCRKSQPMAFADVLDAWQDDAGFCEWFNTLLAELPFAAFRWETPPATAATFIRPFERVVLDSPGLARRPDPQEFAEHFSAAQEDVVSFPNLGGDAIMVVPRPLGELSAYGHLAAFVRSAPETQRHALWQAVGSAMRRRVGSKPVWLSTAGAGVSWLHVRLDDRPKYYGFRPYTKSPTLTSNLQGTVA